MTHSKHDEVPATKPCRVCGEDIKLAARKCVHCESWQDLRGELLSASTTTLSLLVALISVATVAIPVVQKATASKDSSLEFAFEVATDTEILILATNRGDRPGVVTGGFLDWTDGKTQGHLLLTVSRPEPSAAVIDPAGTTLVSLRWIHSRPAAWSGRPLHCSLTVSYSEFSSGPHTKPIDIDCASAQRFTS